MSSHPMIAISKPEHIEYIIRFRARWSKQAQLMMLMDAKQKLLAFRAVKSISGDEYLRLSQAVEMTCQEIANGRN